MAKLRGRNAETTQAVFLERINWYKKRHLIEANQNASDMTASYSAAEVQNHVEKIAIVTVSSFFRFSIQIFRHHT